MDKKEQAKQESRRLTKIHKAQLNAPYSTHISKRSTRQSKMGFSHGLYYSQRGASIYGKPSSTELNKHSTS